MQKTVQNLAAAFIGESQARNRYTMYAGIAKKEGYMKISALFTLTSDQEHEHAKWLMRMINELGEKGASINDIKVVEAEVPTVLGDTKSNIKAAIAGENYEQTSMYPEFADVAEAEGLPQIAARLRSIAKAEENHEKKYREVLQEIEDGTVFAKNEEVVWQCKNCGYIHMGKKAPAECPACSHPQAYFEVR